MQRFSFACQPIQDRSKISLFMIKKILIVDDDIDILEPLALLLESNGYTVKTTSKGEQTYAAINIFKPNLILLDILMSGSDGRTICKKLKNDKKTKIIPVIMMSAHPGADRDALQVGANDFIAKPFETDELLEVVEKHLQSM